MGRGRAKAKQTKVARELKYSTHGTDLDRLQAELAAARGETPPAEVEDSDVDEYDDPYADPYADDLALDGEGDDRDGRHNGGGRLDGGR